MASDITKANSGTFTTSKMRPAPNEQGDALWAATLADNDGYNYFREIPLEDTAPTGVFELWFPFTKRPSHNGIKALTRGLESKAVTEYMRVFAEGADPTDHTACVLAGTLAYTRGVQVTQRFDLDISGLRDGQEYMVAYARDTSGTSVRPAVWLTHGSNASY